MVNRKMNIFKLESLKKAVRSKGCLAILLCIFLFPLLLCLANIAAGIYAGDRVYHYPDSFHPRLGRVLTPGKDVTNPIETFTGSSGASSCAPTYRIKVNSFGFRGPEISWGKPSMGETTRIVCAGDSNTFGMWIDDSRTYVRRLETILNAWLSPGKFETVNLGLYGHTSHTGRLLLHDRGIPLKPDIVIISFGTNDPANTATAGLPASGGIHGRPSFREPDKGLWPFDYQPTRWDYLKAWVHNWLKLPVSRSNLMQLVRGRHVRDRKKDQEAVEYVPRVSQEDYSENMRAMARMVTDAGARPMFLAFKMNPEYKARMREVAAEFGAPYIEDIEIYRRHGKEALESERFKQDRKWSESMIGIDRLSREPIFYFTLDGRHPSPLGHELIAQDMAEIIFRMLREKNDE